MMRSPTAGCCGASAGCAVWSAAGASADGAVARAAGKAAAMHKLGGKKQFLDGAQPRGHVGVANGATTKRGRALSGPVLLPASGLTSAAQPPRPPRRCTLHCASIQDDGAAFFMVIDRELGQDTIQNISHPLLVAWVVGREFQEADVVPAARAGLAGDARALHPALIKALPKWVQVAGERQEIAALRIVHCGELAVFQLRDDVPGKGQGRAAKGTSPVAGLPQACLPLLTTWPCARPCPCVLCPAAPTDLASARTLPHCCKPPRCQPGCI